MSNDDSSAVILTGLNVLVTRPAHQQQSLVDAIQDSSASTVSLPLLEITPIPKSEIAPETIAAIQNLDRFDILIFVSSNAAQIGGDLIDNYWPQFPVGITVIAIGQTTSRAVTTLLECTVITPEQGSDSEAVLALPQLEDVAGKRVGIMRGRGGRELLQSELTERGAEVTVLEVYERNAIPYDTNEVTELLGGASCNVITVHSGESLLRLLELTGDNRDQITLLPLVVPSDRVRKIALDEGFSDVLNARGADDSSMLAALQRVAAQADN